MTCGSLAWTSARVAFGPPPTSRIGTEMSGRSKVTVRSGLLRDISAFSADSVWAVGYASLDEYDQETGTLVLRWDGDEWLKIATPKGIDGLDNITATGRDEAWVVPDYSAGAPSPLWRWGGSTWTQEVDPLNEISAMSALDGDLWAAGSDGPASPLHV